MQCTNNLKQLGLSLHNFHDVQQRFPAGQHDSMVCQAYKVTGVDTGYKLPWTEHISAFVLLTPYIEQAAIFSQVTDCLQRAQSKYSSGAASDSWIPIPRREWVFDANGTSVASPYAISLKALGCPSDGNFTTPNDGTTVGHTNYCLNTHGDKWSAWDWVGRGVFRNERPGSNGSPVAYSLVNITDGTSNTIMVSELCTGPDGDPHIKSGFVNSTTFRANNLNPSVCLAVRGTGGMLDPSQVTGGSLTGDTWSGRGRFWSCTPQIYTVFQTILPPNMPTCRANDNAWTLSTASSYHTGGVNGVFADGSVHFISDTIDSGEINLPLGWNGMPPYTGGNPGGYPPAGYNGPSTFGIWGAIGTINGEEIKSLY
jgi:prepilin-type processing-associated H-X9-DG protein